MKPSHLSAILAREFAAAGAGSHTPVMLWGAPGTGKSEIVAAVASCHAVPLIDLRLSQLEPTDLRGIPFRVDDHVLWSVPALLPDAIRHGPRGILFLDEINAAPPTVTAAAYQLILDRRLGEYRVPGGWALFAAGNRQGDRGVTYAMPAPLANRFTHYHLEPHLDDWVAWALGAGVDARVIAFLRFRPELLFDFDAARDPVAYPSPRTWAYAHRALGKFGDRPDLLFDALQACVGMAAAAEFKAFLDHLEHLPDVDAIARGESQEIPAAVDLQYAVAAALVRHAQRVLPHPGGEAVLGHILDYARRFPDREMGMMLAADLQRAMDRPLIYEPRFALWAESLGELLRPSP